MPAGKRPLRTLRPSLIAYALEGLTKALDDIVVEYSEERQHALAGVAVATRVFAAELARFYHEQDFESERQLDALEQRWLARK